MKKLTFTLFALITALLFLNNARGPIVVQQRGYTGAPGDQPNTCLTCHNSGTFNPTMTIELFDSIGTTRVTRYALNRQYTVRLSITTAAGTTASGFGFQLIDLRRTDNSNVQGFLPKDKQDANIGIDTLTSGTTKRVYAEHNARLTSNVINVRWKAPATDLGIITFYGAGNAVNAGNTNAGDNGTPSANLSISSPSVTGINELAENVAIQVSPNPTVSDVVLNLESKKAKDLSVRIVDISGRTIITEKWSVQVGNNKRVINMSTVSKGAYMVQIVENQNVISSKIIKN
jgi:hypothetical protein